MTKIISSDNENDSASASAFSPFASSSAFSGIHYLALAFIAIIALLLLWFSLRRGSTTSARA